MARRHHHPCNLNSIHKTDIECIKSAKRSHSYLHFFRSFEFPFLYSQNIVETADRDEWASKTDRQSENERDNHTFVLVETNKMLVKTVCRRGLFRRQYYLNTI